MLLEGCITRYTRATVIMSETNYETTVLIGYESHS